MTVPRTVWSCTECDTNNTLDLPACRICDGERTAMCRVVEPPAPVPWRQVTPDPRFGPPRHALRALELPFGGTPPDRTPTRRPVPPPAPPPAPLSDPEPARSPVPPPKPPPVPPPSRRAPSGGGARRVAGVSSVLAAVGIGVVVLVQLFASLVPDGGGTEPAAPAATAPVPCPEAVARHLPTPGATLVAAYQTDRHLVTLCRLPDDRVFYDGRRKDRPATRETLISLPAGQTRDGWLARNGDTTYEVTGDTLVVSEGSTVLLRDPLRPVTR